MQRARSTSNSSNNNNQQQQQQQVRTTSNITPPDAGASSSSSRVTTPRVRGSSTAKVVAPDDGKQTTTTNSSKSIQLPPLLQKFEGNNNGNQHQPTLDEDDSAFGFVDRRGPAKMESKNINNNNNVNEDESGKKIRNLRSDSIFNGFRSGVLGVNNNSNNSGDSYQQLTTINNINNKNSALAFFGNKTGQKSSSRFLPSSPAAMMMMMRNKNDPYEHVLYHVEEVLYHIEMGACPPAKKIPEKFVTAVAEAREKELWSYPTGRVRDSNGNKRFTRVTLPDGSHELGHEADEPAQVPLFPVSIPLENNVLTPNNHPVLVALRENNQFAKKKKAPPKKLPGAEFMPPDIGYGNMNWDGVLRSVCLSQLNIGATCCKRIARAMILNHTVLTLDLSECVMRDEGCIELCSCLARNDTLKILNISGNNLTSACAEPIADLIKSERSKIITLFAACNNLGNETAIEIAKVLSKAPSLEFLNLRANSIDDVGASALLAAAQPSNNKKLTALWLQLNIISEELMQSVTALMEQKCPDEILRALAPKKKKKSKKTGGGQKSLESSSTVRPTSSVLGSGDASVNNNSSAAVRTASSSVRKRSSSRR